MKLQTIVNIPDYTFRTGYGKKNLFLGSCFSESIGNKMKMYKFDTNINPFGILYNPYSIIRTLKLLLEQKKFKSEDLYFRDGLWHSFDHHGRFSSSDKELMLEKINLHLKEGYEYLIHTDYLYITFGTAWIYEMIKTGEIVSNCHKFPAKDFKRYRLSIAQIVDNFSLVLEKIWGINPGLKIIFTVSPIRHWKDGAYENQLSKATLFLAIDEILKNFNEQKCFYFPSYEIIMDELRDYRFFKEDMIHLTDVAINYIWKKFTGTLVDKESDKINIEVDKILKAYMHRPFNMNTSEHRKFILKSLDEAKKMEKKYPNLNLKLEIKYFEEQLA